jgi:hypothetical protein
VIDSGGKAERSSGCGLAAALGFVAAAVFGPPAFFFRAGFVVFRRLAEAVYRRVDFLAGLDAGFFLAFAIGKGLCPGLPEISCL